MVGGYLYCITVALGHGTARVCLRSPTMATRRTSNEASSTLPDVAPDADHFAVLGLPRRFDLTEADINAAYRQMARNTHPDRFGSASADTIARATQLSAAVNDAHRTLADPVTRASYVLTLAGGPAADPGRHSR